MTTCKVTPLLFPRVAQISLLTKQTQPRQASFSSPAAEPCPRLVDGSPQCKGRGSFSQTDANDHHSDGCISVRMRGTPRCFHSAEKMVTRRNYPPYQPAGAQCTEIHAFIVCLSSGTDPSGSWQTTWPACSISIHREKRDPLPSAPKQLGYGTGG